MTTQLQVGSQVIQADQVLSLLHRYQLMSQIMRGMVIDQAIAGISCTQEEHTAAVAEFEKQHQITSPEAQSAWLKRQAMTLEQMEDLAIRPAKVEKFKTATWGHRVESYFLTRKSGFDQVIYSLIRTKHRGVAQEVYFRIKEGEQSFSELARQFSQGVEARTGGLLGPVPLTHPHPVISKLLAVSKPSQLWSPRAVGEWFVIVRLEKFFPARLDEQMRHRLINELFETWLQEQLVEPASSGLR